MKKLLIGALIAGLASSSLMAWRIADAKIQYVDMQSNGDIKISMTNVNRNYIYRISNNDSEGKKAMLAGALTALTTQQQISAEIVSSEIRGLFLKKP